MVSRIVDRLVVDRVPIADEDLDRCFMNGSAHG